MVVCGSCFDLERATQWVQSLERFIVNYLSKIPGIASIKSSFSLKQVKYQTALPLT